MPAFPNHTGRAGVPNVPRSVPAVRSFADGPSPIFEERNFTVSGISRDANGAPLPGCTMMLFNWTTKALEQTTVSDAAGAYSFTVDKTAVWRVVADNPAGPVAGISRNDLVGT